MQPFAIAGIQMEVSSTRDNIPAMAQHLDDLMYIYPWVQMVLFSELCSCGLTTRHAQPIPGPAERAFQEMAKKHGIWLIPGSMYELTPDEQVYNTACVIDPTGRIVGRYRKMFPFFPYEKGVVPGTEPFVFDVPGVGRFGVSICYDMWIPETVRALACMGAEVILHPSLTDTIDRDVELAIVRATAACQQCYVLDVNGVGDGGNGRSLFCGPHGETLYQAGTSEVVIPFEVDLDRVRRSREVGLRNLGQPLKSFRDRACEFRLYHPDTRAPYLETLGPLVKPTRGSLAGIGVGAGGDVAGGIEAQTAFKAASAPAQEAAPEAAASPRSR